jgi:phosphohistidine phosphatase SixA
VIYRIFLLVLIGSVTSCTHSYYIVRHAEKAAQGPDRNSDVPLTDSGRQRALAIREILKDKKIRYVYATNTIRTRSTAEPTADYFGLKVETYQPAVPTPDLIRKFRALKKNVLIVGHSNTVDNLVNELSGKTNVPGDLADTEYNHLFIVKIKGRRVIFRAAKIYPQ